MSVPSDLSQLVPITATIALESTTSDIEGRKKAIRKSAELADNQLNTLYAYFEMNDAQKN